MSESGQSKWVVVTLTPAFSMKIELDGAAAFAEQRIEIKIGCDRLLR